jgi:hypothetical protein
MVELYRDLSIEDLVAITEVVHDLKPKLDTYFCVGVKEPQPGDANVIFYMLDPNANNGKGDKEVVMISADFIVNFYYKSDLVSDQV